MMKKLLAILMALTFIFALASCGSKTEGETTTTEAITEESETETETETQTEAESKEDESETETTTEGESKEDKTEEDESTTEKEEQKVPSTKAEILAAYTEVMNQAKKDAPGFTKTEYQELPEAGRVINKGETLVNTALKVAGNFMTTKDKAESDPEIKEKGNNMRSWPVLKCPKGCMLTNESAIKSAKCEELSNGNYKITIVLNDENNPEPAKEGATTAPSAHGSVFSPLSKSEIDDALNGGIVSAVFKDITYTLRYHDCSTVLVYNPENNHVVSLDQTCHVSIKASAKALGATLDIGNQELINYMSIKNIKY